MRAHCSQCNRTQDITPVAGSKDSGFCQQCGLRIEIPRPLEPEGLDRRQFVKNAVTTVATGAVGTVLGELIHDSILKPTPAPTGRAVALKIHLGVPYDIPPAERAAALASNFGKPFPAPVNIEVQVADAITFADGVDLSVA